MSNKFIDNIKGTISDIKKIYDSSSYNDDLERKLARKMADKIGPRQEFGANDEIHISDLLTKIRKKDYRGAREYVGKQREKYLKQKENKIYKRY